MSNMKHVNYIPITNHKSGTHDDLRVTIYPDEYGFGGGRRLIRNPGTRIMRVVTAVNIVSLVITDCLYVFLLTSNARILACLAGLSFFMTCFAVLKSSKRSHIIPINCSITSSIILVGLLYVATGKATF